MLIEEHKAKLELVESEMKLYRDSNELIQTKIQNIYTNNILIPKKE